MTFILIISFIYKISKYDLIGAKLKIKIIVANLRRVYISI